jgi:hypothetical protein
MKGTSLSPGNCSIAPPTLLIPDGYIFGPRELNCVLKMPCCDDLSHAGAATKSAGRATTNVAVPVQLGARRAIPPEILPDMIVAQRLLLGTPRVS